MLVYPNAKINIGLDVVGKRPDGYHNIETVFYPIGLSDVLDVQLSEGCSDYSFSSSGIQLDGDPEQNLIVKAFRLLQFDYHIPPIDISLVKQIPFGAGLGGGSSDAAFMLNALNDMLGLDISTARLEQFASKLGADCPVFIQNKPIFASGIGDEFRAIKLSLEGYFLLLIKPDIFVSTPEAYSLVVPQEPVYSLFESIQQPIWAWRQLIKNDFEPSVFKLYPAIEQIKLQLYDMGAIYASMSGSGSAVYGIFHSEPSEIIGFEDCFITGGEL